MKQALRELILIAFIWGTAVIGGLCICLSSSGIPAVVMGVSFPLAALMMGLIPQAIHQVFVR